MLMAIIVIFVLCWAPTLTDNVLVAFGVLHKYNYDYLKYMRQAFVLMSYMNSAVNPIVYAFMSRNFRFVFINFFVTDTIALEFHVCCIKGHSQSFKTSM